MPLRLFILLSPLLGFFALSLDFVLSEDGLPGWLPTLITFACFALPSLILTIVLHFTRKPLRPIFTFAGIFPAFIASVWVVWMLLFGPPDALAIFAIFLVPALGILAMPFSILIGYYMYKQMEKYEQRK